MIDIGLPGFVLLVALLVTVLVVLARFLSGGDGDRAAHPPDTRRMKEP